MEILIERPPEEWREVPNTNGRYQVSNYGRVMSLLYVHNRGYDSRVRKHLMRPQKWTNGYLFVRLSVDGQIKQHSIHRLVASAFYGESDLEVNHKDGVVSNNALWNLEYVTRHENQIHSYRVLGRPSAKAYLGKKGFLHNKSKAIQLTDVDSGERIVFGSMREANANGYCRRLLAKAIRKGYLYRNKYKISYYEGAN